MQGPGNGSTASSSSSSSSAAVAFAASAAAPSNRLEMPFASVPESVPGGPASSSSALGDGGPKGVGKGKGGQMSDSVPATLPPRKNYDEDSNQSGALRQAIYAFSFHF